MLDLCMLNHGNKFCNRYGCDIIPIRVVALLDSDNAKSPSLVKESFHQEEVSIEELSFAEVVDGEWNDNVESKDDDFLVPKLELKSFKCCFEVGKMLKEKILVTIQTQNLQELQEDLQERT